MIISKERQKPSEISGGKEGFGWTENSGLVGYASVSD